MAIVKALLAVALLLTLCLSMIENIRLAVPRVYFQKGGSQTFYDAESALARMAWLCSHQTLKKSSTSSSAKFSAPGEMKLRNSKVKVRIRDINSLIPLWETKKLNSRRDVEKILLDYPDKDIPMHTSSINIFSGKASEEIGVELDFERQSPIEFADEINFLPPENMLTEAFDEELTLSFQEWIKPVIPTRYTRRRASTKPSFYYSEPELILLDLDLEKEDLSLIKEALETEREELPNLLGAELHSQIKKYYTFALPNYLSVIIEADNGFARSKIIYNFSPRDNLPKQSSIRVRHRSSWGLFAK